MYRTRQIRIRKGHRMYEYLKNQCVNAMHLYNRGNYLIRQYATAVRDIGAGKTPDELSANQREAYELIREVTEYTKYEPKSSWLSYGQLDYILKQISDSAYRGLPAQSNQQILKRLMRDYRSFFEALKVYGKNSNAFTGRPHLPGYKKESKGVTAVFTNQICRIQEGQYLKFPGTKNRINIGSIVSNRSNIKDVNEPAVVNIQPDPIRLKEVRVKPQTDGYMVEVVLEYPDINAETLKKQNPLLCMEETELKETLGQMKDIGFRAASIDPGLDNFAAVTNNFGEKPFLVRGSILKSENHYYNKRLAELRSKAKLCNNRQITKRISRLHDRRNRIIKDQMHKISRMITDWAVEKEVKLVVMGHNTFQKQEIDLGHVNNQNYVQIPFSVFAGMLKYKLEERGIALLLTEESYTSKADFIAGDELPEYNKNDPKPEMSGERVRRGLYRHANGSISNADINGAANILRKVFPNVKEWDRGIVDIPYAVRIA